jgi:2',3'-cyclic-nucleotide 2'-phosphodiesterase/3'-nucleotidase
MAAVDLRLIGVTDVHARLRPYDYYRDRPDETQGLAKAATLIRALRAERPNALTFDNGDLIQGTPLGDWAAGTLDAHPMIAALEALGVDAASVGNHEFNYGLDVLDRVLAGANFPTVCCNVLRADGSLYFKPWTLIARRVADRSGVVHDLKIGVVGFVTPQIMRWDRNHLDGRVTARPIVEAAREHVAACRAAGADVIVALCHAGISKIGPDGAAENAGLALAQVGGIDAIFLGHQHLLLPGADFVGIDGVDPVRGTLAGVPAVMGGCFGAHVGVIDLTLENEAGSWRATGATAAIRSIDATTPADPALMAASEAAHAATLAYVRAPVGRLETPLASYFAMIGDDPSVRVVHDAQLWFGRGIVETNPALGAAPLLSAASPFKCGGRNGADFYTEVPAGPLLLRNVADLYVYPNGLRIVRATGADVREWLERAASVFLTIDPARTAPQPLLSASFAPYDFDSLAGVTYRLDLTAPPRYDERGRVIAPDAHRVVDLAFAGRAVEGGQIFHIVTNSYRANGGGNFPGCDGRSVLYEAPETNFDALLAYVKAHPTLRPSPGGEWRLAPWPAGVAATLLAPPSAADSAPPPGVTVAPLGPGPNGFATFRVIPSRGETHELR